MSSFKDRKESRKQHYEKCVKGWKQKSCIACNGSGRYDHKGSPKCGACNGTGKEFFKPILT
jgi:DnaJ-class molecular chaperone